MPWPFVLLLSVCFILSALSPQIFGDDSDDANRKSWPLSVLEGLQFVHCQDDYSRKVFKRDEQTQLNWLATQTHCFGGGFLRQLQKKIDEWNEKLSNVKRKVLELTNGQVKCMKDREYWQSRLLNAIWMIFRAQNITIGQYFLEEFLNNIEHNKVGMGKVIQIVKKQEKVFDMTRYEKKREANEADLESIKVQLEEKFNNFKDKVNHPKKPEKEYAIDFSMEEHLDILNKIKAELAKVQLKWPSTEEKENEANKVQLERTSTGESKANKVQLEWTPTESEANKVQLDWTPTESEADQFWTIDQRPVVRQTLWIIRHAEREDNVNKKWGKDLSELEKEDSPLSERGIRQAEELGRWFGKINVDRVYASPFIRCLETANELIGGKNYPRGSIQQGTDQRGSDQKESDKTVKGKNQKGKGSDQKGSDQKGSDQKGSGQKESDQKVSDQKGSDQKGSDQKGSDQKESDMTVKGKNQKGKRSDQKGSNQKGSDQKESDQKESDQKGSDQKGSDQKGSDQKESDQKESDQKGSDQKGSDQKGSDQKESDKTVKGKNQKGKRSDQKGSDQKGTDQKGSDQKESDQKESDQKESDQKGSDQKGSDQKGSVQKESDQKGSDQKGSDQKRSDQKGSDQKESDMTVKGKNQKGKRSDQKGSNQKGTDQKGSDQKESDQKESDQKESDQKGSYKKGSDQKESDQKESDQKGSDQKESDQKESDQKESDQKGSDQIEWIDQRGIFINCEPGLAEFYDRSNIKFGFKPCQSQKTFSIDSNYLPLFNGDLLQMMEMERQERSVGKERSADDHDFVTVQTIRHILENNREAENIVFVTHMQNIGLMLELMGAEWAAVGQATISKLVKYEENVGIGKTSDVLQQFRLEYASGVTHLTERKDLRPR
ncbi:hypothetical protein niasHS_005945 [Heterodera schachtii]|uniref:Uncharacterized protein n=1 Tax=Heterodera schachtii TaxID=97005 RepID=A0ABD2JMZ5_HETSC